MSEPAPEPGSGTPRGKAKGKKILGLNRGTALGIGVTGLAVVAYLIYRARKNAAASSAATTATATAGSCPDGSAPDANGNCPQSSQDFSGQLETLQSEIAALQGAGASGAGGGGSAGTVGAATGTTTTPAPAAGTTTTTPAAAAKAAAGPISNLQATSVGTTTATVRWNPAQGATGGYSYQLTDTSDNSKRTPVTTRATTATVTGLKSKTTYNFGVQGLPGGDGNNIHFTTK